ncbi:hypothetical protein FA321_32645, partial [Pseudomonas aeruginosa]|nr:hypothetical protein [Pseudomonas aeruginosa]
LLALASVLGVGEGHLLHRETRWVGSRYFAKSESLFQSFPKAVSLYKKSGFEFRERFVMMSHSLK